MREKLKQLFDKSSNIHLGINILLFILSMLGVYSCAIMSWVSLILVDTYLILILAWAAIKSDIEIKDDNLLPTKTSSLIIFTFLFFTVVFGFAGLFIQSNLIDFNETFDAIYFSFSIITTIGECSTENSYLKGIVIWEISSGLLLFAGIFGLLISRISDYKK